MTGNEAASYIAYALSENSFIYPITPSSAMGEYFDLWKTIGRNNIWGKKVGVQCMQSEAGAAGAVHGSIAAGSLTTTFTASQGLLLKIPNMFLIAGELMPTVFHIAARSVHKHALSIHGDHMDVMHARSTGFGQIASSSVQECQDNALIAHLSTLESRIPFIHFFDGFRTSHEIAKIETISYDQIRQLFNEDALQKNLRAFQLNPHHPIMRGTGQRPEYFFQASMAAQPFYQKAPDIIEEIMKKVQKATGRKTQLFEYIGCDNPERVIMSMGSSNQTIEQTVEYLNKLNPNEKVGMIKVRVYRPWSYKHFFQVLPKSVKKIAVMDRTREEGALGGPLFLDVASTLAEFKDRQIELITNSTYGLSSKEFTPSMVKAVFDNLNSQNPIIHNVVGIVDDVNKISLPLQPEFDPNEVINPQSQQSQCIFWGLGSDGTIGANQNAIMTIANETDLKVQGFFAYDAYKTDGVTCSHLRFGKDEIKSPYMISSNANYIACHNKKYIKNLDMVQPLKQNGIFVLNCNWQTIKEVEDNFSAKMKKQLAQRDAQLYVVNASQIAQDVGLKKRINNIMQAVFYKLSAVLPEQEAINLLKKDIVKSYKVKGDYIINMNLKAVDETFKNLIKINYNKQEWLNAKDNELTEHYSDKIDVGDETQNSFFNDVFTPILNWQGDQIPVSKFTPGGYLAISGTTQQEKRSIAINIPIWKPNECTQCNYCSLVCPHAAIRPFLLEKHQNEQKPKFYEVRKAKGGSEMQGLFYSIMVSPNDCTGCEICVQTCPDQALYMAPVENSYEKGALENWKYSVNLPFKKNPLDKFSVKGSQFEQPLLEFSGACGSCGETAYVKLLTQLFGERMVIANATGCSMIWGSMFPSNPYTVRKENKKGPAYGHSLFEDNAEYGYGIAVSNQKRKENLYNDIQKILQLCKHDVNKMQLIKQLEEWLKNRKNAAKCEEIYANVSKILEEYPEEEFLQNQYLKNLRNDKDLLSVQSTWIIGGDGWAYDIGYGGLDHIISTDVNVNILILDTEMYSNTGGQESKATPTSASVKFDLGGKIAAKKDILLQAISYRTVYVASIAIGANYAQTIQALKEAEEYPGPSLINSLTPCIGWGFKNNNELIKIQEAAVKSGYWPLYRYDPRKKEKKFTLDFKKIQIDVSEYLDKQLRFNKLKNENPQLCHSLQEDLRSKIKEKMDVYQRMAMDDFDMLDFLKKKLGEKSTQQQKTLVLYGSETGNAQSVAIELAYQLKRRNIRSTFLSLDDIEIQDLQDFNFVYFVVATAGQGEMPKNAKLFWKKLNSPNLKLDNAKSINYAVFGLGDSSYAMFNKAAEEIDRKMTEIGAQRVVPLGLGDDKDGERYETKWQEWAPNLYNEVNLEQPKEILFDASFQIVNSTVADTDTHYTPNSFQEVPLKLNSLLTPPTYDRDIRHYTFDISGREIQYGVGDCLAIMPRNNEQQVQLFLENHQLHSNQMINISKINQDCQRKLPQNITYFKLFSEVLDVFGRPNRNLYEFLSICAKAEHEKSQLKYLISKEGQKDFKDLFNETVTVADLLDKFPSSVPSIEYMIEYFPIIKPRLYSIASANCKMGNDLELCIILNDWTTPSKKYRQGLTTSYLKKLEGGKDKVIGQIVDGPCPHPNIEIPAILVGLGTGIAPIRAFVQERAHMIQKGKKVGKVYIVYGNRHEKTEFLYKDELQSYKKLGVIGEIFTAFSRDQKEKVYVQHRIEQNMDMVNEILNKQKGYFYLCGQAGTIPNQVQQAIASAFIKNGKMTKVEANNYILKMRIDGRYCLDVW